MGGAGGVALEGEGVYYWTLGIARCPATTDNAIRADPSELYLPDAIIWVRMRYCKTTVHLGDHTPSGHRHDTWLSVRVRVPAHVRGHAHMHVRMHACKPLRLRVCESLCVCAREVVSICIKVCVCVRMCLLCNSRMCVRLCGDATDQCARLCITCSM